jgi:AcrR family transcriptional regulator
MRRTKEEAARTHDAIVEAALACFDKRGIAHTTLDEIAAAAGVTKGAVYHHFGGKREILHEIRMRVSVPLLDKADTALLAQGSLPALPRIEKFLLAFVDILEKDARTRRTLGVMQFKCEFVGDLAGELPSMLRNHRHLQKAFESAYVQAHAAGELAPGVEPRMAALTSVVFLNGLIRLWLLDKALRKHARSAVHTHMQLRTPRWDRPPGRRVLGKSSS